MGSWSYPEHAWSKVYGVPLYSGFMYASVASYICQAWRRFGLRFRQWPNYAATTGAAVLIYANFFTHHVMPDLRWELMLGLFVLFFRTSVLYTVGGKTFRMHIFAAFALIAFFIWVAENISTFLGAWRYPNQESHWHLVYWGKISSWFLLVMISIIIVVQLKDLKYRVIPGTAGSRASTAMPERNKSLKDSSNVL